MRVRSPAVPCGPLRSAADPDGVRGGPSRQRGVSGTALARQGAAGGAGPARWGQVYGMAGCAGVTPAARAEAPRL